MTDYSELYDRLNKQAEVDYTIHPDYRHPWETDGGKLKREELTMKCQYNVKYTTDPQHALTIYKECDSTIVEQVTITSKEAIDAIVKKIDDALKGN